MRDLEIRCALHQELKSLHMNEADTLVVDELGLCQGISRVDVAVINGSITGYEIKSEQDTLSRLPTQAEVYGKVLDRLIIVSGGRHVESVANIVPEWCGIQLAIAEGAAVRLENVRDANENPNVDPYALVQLLWRDEALLTLKDIGLEKGMLSKPRQSLWKALVQNLSVSDLKAHVRKRLKARVNWRSVV